MTGRNDATPSPPLTPLVARALELGRGPPALLRWVAARRDRGLSPRELAAELAGEVARAGAAARDTLPAGASPRARDTIC